MERDSKRLMTPFDCKTTPQWIYILKLMLPYTPDKYQHMLAVFIRFQEIQFTLNHFHGFYEKEQTGNLFHDVKPYMDSKTQEMMEQMESMLNMMEMLQMMQEVSQNNPDSTDNPQHFNPMDILSGFMPEDLADIFNMKGDCDHE